MAQKTEANSPAFDYELYEGDPERLRTVIAAPANPSPYVEPASLQFKYRIGHGLLGDVWLATHHQSGTDYDEYHEVAVKMLHPINNNGMNKFLRKFEDLWMNLNSRKFEGLCWLHGISVISGKICIVMKFYEGSIGDRVARLKGGKLPLSDVLRYGIELARGIQALHVLGSLALNLKPTNFLLTEQDQVILGDFGIPYLLLGVPHADSKLELRLGTPNYMAPEQWDPQVRGPVALETDSWGFGCSILEMLTGVQPWFGEPVNNIFQLVVIKQEKPQVPGDLPPTIENVLKGCFQYDPRNRPLLADIQQAFESSQNAVCIDGEWTGISSKLYIDKMTFGNYTRWYFSKDRLQVGDIVRSRRSAHSGKLHNKDVGEGTVVGLEKDSDQDGFVLVRIPHLHNPLRVNVSSLERVTYGFASGHWVRMINDDKRHSSVGILHTIQRDGSVCVAFLGLETLWEGHCSELQIAEPHYIGQFVKIKPDISTPRFQFLHTKNGEWATGKIIQILPNGCLVIDFPGRLRLAAEPRHFLADPDEVERVSFDKCHGVVEKYQHIEDFHWTVRPLAIAFAVLTALRLGVFVGVKVGSRLKKGQQEQKRSEGRPLDVQGSSNSAWLPPAVANILYKEGSTSTVVR
ncbi:hypothetical protein LIER_17146 [Lithospermum erythrorhizon]|uniref:Protein kinase domain-containing protein n=1 Tax=Lithospermum erythrorhizon TaxID=34254 RepID=A0AAV3QBM4_LITER